MDRLPTLATLASVVRRVPPLLWLVLILALYLGYKEIRDSWVVDALRAEVARGRDEAVNSALKLSVQREAEVRRRQEVVERDLASISARQTAQQRTVDSARAAVAASGAESRRLVESGTVDEVLAALRARGYHPRALP